MEKFMLESTYLRPLIKDGTVSPLQHNPCCYLYTIGMSYLPVSISSLLSSTSLAFTAIFAYFMVKHKFTHYSVNAVVLMMLGSIILGLHMNGDRPIGESNRQYTLGFVMTIIGAALHGFLNAGVEYSHVKAGVVVTFDLVMQIQFLISMFSSLFCIVAIIINRDFQAITREAEEFGLGQKKYYMILALTAISLQTMMIGSLGMIFCSSALLFGIVNALLIPIQQIFAVIFLPESFNSDKWMALAMCLWGFASYFYGEYKDSMTNKVTKNKHATLPDQLRQSPFIFSVFRRNTTKTTSKRPPETTTKNPQEPETTSSKKH
uniref:Probable purine permease n=1 Tax=Solanum tuberosum TaxID=4113 RepID=M1BI70_SOLTU